MSDSSSPFHVVHILGSLKSGGVEKWLYDMQQHAGARRHRHTYIVSELTGSDLEAQFVASGARILVCDVRRGAMSYARQLYQCLRHLTPVDAVHSHVHAFSALNLLIAAACGIPVRVAHSHTDRSWVDASASIYRRVYLRVAKRLLRGVMTGGVAVSKSAATDLFGNEAAWGDNIKIVPCGVDLSRFEGGIAQGGLRERLGILPSERVLMHVGNFVEPKNHKFIVEVAQELLKKQYGIRIVFVGSGPLEGNIRDLVKQSGLHKQFLFLGSRADVPHLLLDVADAFLFPSLWEGLPVALIEAQAAGLPCVVSDCITKEADAPGAIVKRLSLEQDASVWAECVESALSAGRHVGDLSGFSISRSHDVVMSLYHPGALVQPTAPRCA